MPHEYESGYVPIDFDEERMSRRVGPVVVQKSVTEHAISVEVGCGVTGEVVGVELQEPSNDVLALQAGWYQLRFERHGAMMLAAAKG